MTEDEIRKAVHEAFGDLGFEYGDPVKALPDEQRIRQYRRRDNVHRPSRGDGQEHGLVVHHLTTAWAVMRAERDEARAEIKALQAQLAQSQRQAAEFAKDTMGEIRALKAKVGAR